MNGSHLGKVWKHWRKSPPSVSLDQSPYRDFLDTPTFDPASPKAIQKQAIITSESPTTRSGASGLDFPAVRGKKQRHGSALIGLGVTVGACAKHPV